MTKQNRTKGTFLKLMILFALPVLALLVAFFVSRVEYTDGEKPTKDVTKYLMDVKMDVLTKCVDKNSSQWIKVDCGNKNAVKLHVTDVDKFNKLLSEKENLMVETMKMFPEHGFKWDKNENTIILPVERSWHRSDYVKIPVWLMSVLLDENVFNLQKEL